MVETATDELLTTLEAPLNRYATRLLAGDSERARDVVQETFLRWVREAATPEGREKIRGHEREWLYTVCRRLCIDIRRKEQPMTPLSDPIAEGLSESSGGGRKSSNVLSAPQKVENQETLSRALKAMESLPDHQQEVLRLKFHDELSYKEIATVTGLSVGNVGFLIHTGLKAIRDQIA